MTTADPDTDELLALIEEHDRLVLTLTSPNATMSLLYVDLIARIADTLDRVLASRMTRDPDGRADRAIGVANLTLGNAIFTADLVANLMRNEKRPARMAIGRWFSDERIAFLRREAAAQPVIEG